MTDDAAFIQAIRAVPFDDAPRLIYADWLEERGQSDRAEFIRIQCQLARLPDGSPEQPALHLRAEKLLRGHWEEWVGPLREIVGPRRDQYGERWMGDKYRPAGLRRFHRGFVSILALDAEDFLRHARSLKSLTPLCELSLWGGGRCARRLAEEPALSGLSLLGFTDYYDAPLTAHDAASLAASPYLHGLSLLILGFNSLGDEGVEALVQAPWLVSVTWLDLTDNGLSDRAARALAESSFLFNLQTLWLNRNYLSPDAVFALRNSPNLRRLTRLEYNPSAENFPAMRRSGP